jgi:hypothetical protein
MSATVQLAAFTSNSTGAPIPFTMVPEPAGWPVLGVCLVLMWWGKRKMVGCPRL